MLIHNKNIDNDNNEKVLSNVILIPTIIPTININNNEKKYFSEILLITNTNNHFDFDLWIRWHLNYIKFDHIVVIDNSKESIVKNICAKHEKIKYIKLEQQLSQSEIYNYYLNNSEAEWVLPIDDDEFLYLNNFVTIKNYINYANSQNNKIKKLAFKNLFLFSEKLLETRDYTKNCFELFNCYCPDTNLLPYDNKITIKTICNTLNDKYYYVIDEQKYNSISYNDLENISNYDLGGTINLDAMGNIHNPLCKENDYYIPAIDPVNKQAYFGIYLNNNKIYDLNTCLLLHFKYKTKEEFLDKSKNNIFTDRSMRYYNECYSCNNLIKNYELNNYFIKTNKFLNIAKKI